MKIILRKVALFIFPAFFCILILEALLPITFFTHRHYEAIKYVSNGLSQCNNYENIATYKVSVGDLCHHTENEVPRNIFWKTDKLGNRNDEFVEKSDIMFFGDSFIEGCTLTQKETISNRVKSKLKGKVSVYNMAPYSINELESFIKMGIIKKPKVIIYSIIERYLPSPIVPNRNPENYKQKTKFNSFLEYGSLNMYIDKAFKFYSVKWIKARISDSKGAGIAGTKQSKMYFLDGKAISNNVNYAVDASKLILSYQKYFDSLGIKFIYMPMPNKETVYFDYVPFKQHQELLKLDSILKKENVLTINTLQIYNEYRKKSTKLLYNLDDTHWNNNATDLISKEIVKTIKKNKKYLGI